MGLGEAGNKYALARGSQAADRVLKGVMDCLAKLGQDNGRAEGVGDLEIAQGRANLVQDRVIVGEGSFVQVVVKEVQRPA